MIKIGYWVLVALILVHVVDCVDVITTIAGTGVTGFSGNNVAATSATLYGPKGIAVDSSGILFIIMIYSLLFLTFFYMKR